MKNTSSKIGYIYSLSYRGVVFYIGQTITPKKRYKNHRSACFLRNKDKYVYQYIKSITTYYRYTSDIEFKVLKVVSLYDIDRVEMKYIKYCIDKGLKLYNNCVGTIQYLNKKNLLS